MVGTDTFGARVKERRQQLDGDVSCEALARAVGVSYRQMQRIEAGENQPRLDLAARIADFLGVPVDALIPERAHASNLPDAHVRTPHGSSENTSAPGARRSSNAPRAK